MISGFSALALQDLASEDASARVHIGEVQRAAERASDLTRQLLAYSRKQVLEKTSLDLNQVVRESETLLRRVIGTIYLPRNETARPKEPVPAASTHEGDETILVVEDEPIVSTLIEKMLTSRGYTVLSAADPEEGLRLSRENEIGAVITDVVMPSMNGPELVEELRRDRPLLRALFTSGYTSDAVLELGVSEADVAFVQKPFTAEELVSRLRQLLDS